MVNVMDLEYLWNYFSAIVWDGTPHLIVEMDLKEVVPLYRNQQQPHFCPLCFVCIQFWNLGPEGEIGPQGIQGLTGFTGTFWSCRRNWNPRFNRTNRE
jgi:hypothetical protein